jgi:hypothetical protein
MFYLTVDGMFSGTGIRDSIEGGYLDPGELGLSDDLIEKISKWLKLYENAHYMQYEDKAQVAKLDSEGIEICIMIRSALPDSKVEYYSSAETRRLVI